MIQTEIEDFVKLSDMVSLGSGIYRHVGPASNKCLMIGLIFFALFIVTCFPPSDIAYGDDLNFTHTGALLSSLKYFPRNHPSSGPNSLDNNFFGKEDISLS